MLIPLVALGWADATLTAVALGVSLRRRRMAVTLAAAAFLSAGTVLAIGLVWVLWLVAPACLGDADLAGCVGARTGSAGIVYAAEIALLQWFWIAGVALCARFVAERNLAHIPG